MTTLRTLMALLALSLGCTGGGDGGGDSDAAMSQADAGGADMQVGAAGFEEHLTATIDGAPFAAQLVAGNSHDGLLQFQSDQSQERQLFFTLPADVEPGTYDLSAEGDYIARYAELFEGAFPAESGTLVVDRIDRERNEVSGTFEFVGAMDTFGEITRVEVTEGRFAVEFNVL